MCFIFNIVLLAYHYMEYDIWFFYQVDSLSLNDWLH